LLQKVVQEAVEANYWQTRSIAWLFCDNSCTKRAENDEWSQCAKKLLGVPTTKHLVYQPVHLT